MASVYSSPTLTLVVLVPEIIAVLTKLEPDGQVERSWE
jgi:hypothetical protein